MRFLQKSVSNKYHAQSLAIQQELRAEIVQKFTFLIWIFGCLGRKNDYT